MGSVNTEYEVRYCKGCKKRRRMLRVKSRATGKGYSYGMPTRWLCTANIRHSYLTRPPAYGPRKSSSTSKSSRSGKRRRK